jgi:hypothetical protein
MKGGPFEYQRHGSPREISPEDGERLYLDEGLVSAIFGMKMRRSVVVKNTFGLQSQRNRVTSGISFFDFTVSARAARDAAAILRDQDTPSPLVFLPDFRDRHIWGPVSSGRRSAQSTGPTLPRAPFGASLRAPTPGICLTPHILSRSVKRRRPHLAPRKEPERPGFLRRLRRALHRRP